MCNPAGSVGPLPSTANMHGHNARRCTQLDTLDIRVSGHGKRLNRATADEYARLLSAEASLIFCECRHDPRCSVQSHRWSVSRPSGR